MNRTAGVIIFPPFQPKVCLLIITNFSITSGKPIGGFRGVHLAHAPPYRSRFFHFDMQNFQNVATLGVYGPPYEVHAPPWEILDLPLKPILCSMTFPNECHLKSLCPVYWNGLILFQINTLNL